ncbi:MAG: serine acetyltransferase [Gemmataceae bacterium]
MKSMTSRSAEERLLSVYENRLSPNTSYYGPSRLPSHDAIKKITDRLIGMVFAGYRRTLPMPTSKRFAFKFLRCFNEIRTALAKEVRLAKLSTAKNAPPSDRYRHWAKRKVNAFLNTLEEVKKTLDCDAEAAFQRDPAVRSVTLIALCYPGIHATAIYRLANKLHKLRVPLIPRMMTEYGKALTGIDIHPGATIKPGFFVDHGAGVVIGETADIGENVTIYQNVTLGSWNFPRDNNGDIIRGAKRHPTVGDHCTLYAGSSVLGGDTFVGRNSEIGANVTLTRSLEHETVLWREKQHLRSKRKHPPVQAPLHGGQETQADQPRSAVSDMIWEGCPNFHEEP